LPLLKVINLEVVLLKVKILKPLNCKLALLKISDD